MERNRTLTGLVNTEPLVGVQLPRAQKLHWFLSEADGDAHRVQVVRLKLLREDSAIAPNGQGVLVIGETGDRKDEATTAQVARQDPGKRGTIGNRGVSVTNLWADERVYDPLQVEPYTPEGYVANSKNDPACRTKLKIAFEPVKQAIQKGIPCRAMVAENFYGEDAA